MRTVIALITASVVAALPALAQADWQQPVGGASPINQSPDRNGDELWLTSVAGWPYIAWNEDTTPAGQGGSSQIRVASLASDGASWQKVGNAGSHPISRLSSTSSHNPTIADVGGTPWVAWSENITQSDQEIRVAKLAGSAWQRVNDSTHPINHQRTDPGGTADYPTIADGGGGQPYVSFYESDPGTGSFIFPGKPAEVWVDRLSSDGTTWAEVGGGPVSDPSFDAAFPRMALVGGVPWIVYFQVALVNNGPALQIAAAHLSDDGQSWVHLPPLATGGFDQFDNPAIASVAGRPTVAFADRGSGADRRVRVLRLNEAGSGWDELGGGPASGSTADAQRASIADVGGAPWVAWRERSSNSCCQNVHVARLNGSAWEPVGGQINDSSSHDASFGPVLASVNGFPWVGFGESDGAVAPTQTSASCCVQERVSRLAPDLGPQSAQASSTTAALITQVSKTYGLPFPVGFEYGPKGGATSSSSTSTPTDDPDVVFREITGLSPSTLYSYRAFTTAGTPVPRVRGPIGYFATQPAATSETGSGATPAPRRVPLVAALVRTPHRAGRGHPIRVRYFVTVDARASLVVRRHGRVVAHVIQRVKAGMHTVVLRQWHPGRYLVVLWAEDKTQHARDVAAIRVTRR